MESSIVQSSVDIKETFSNSMNEFIPNMIKTMFLSPVSILIYGGIAILIIRIIYSKMKKKNKK